MIYNIDSIIAFTLKTVKQYCPINPSDCYLSRLTFFKFFMVFYGCKRFSFNFIKKLLENTTRKNCYSLRLEQFFDRKVFTE